ncbi:MAG: hypothetical protein ABEI99_05365, partial [Halobaculum sp.]
MDLPDDEQAVMRDLASALGFDLDDHVETALETATTLGETVDPPDESVATRLQRDSAGTIADDPYGALLDTYDDPRTDGERDGGPLGGLSFAVKDVIAAADLRMTCGSDTFSVVPL